MNRTKKSLRVFLMVGASTAVVWITGCGGPSASNGKVDATLVNRIESKSGGAAGGAAGGVETLGTPTGWATLKGRFVVQGTPPAASPIPMGENKDMCPPAKTEVVVTGSGGELRNVLLYLDDDIPDDSGEAQPLWTHPSYNLANNAEAAPDTLLPQQRQEVVFDQKNCRFLDHVFAFRSNQGLRIVNSDPFGHNTNLKPRDKARPFDQTIPPGASTVYEPGGPEKRPFPVSCAIHPWMSARMIIRDNPYFAVTGEDGTFEIRNIPAGVKLSFRVWQEGANYLEDVTVNGQQTEWSKGKLEVTLDPDEVRNLDVLVNASAFQS